MYCVCVCECECVGKDKWSSRMFHCKRIMCTCTLYLARDNNNFNEMLKSLLISCVNTLESMGVTRSPYFSPKNIDFIWLYLRRAYYSIRWEFVFSQEICGNAKAYWIWINLTLKSVVRKSFHCHKICFVRVQISSLSKNFAPKQN